MSHGLVPRKIFFKKVPLEIKVGWMQCIWKRNQSEHKGGGEGSTQTYPKPTPQAMSFSI